MALDLLSPTDRLWYNYSLFNLPHSFRSIQGPRYISTEWACNTDTSLWINHRNTIGHVFHSLTAQRQLSHGWLTTRVSSLWLCSLSTHRYAYNINQRDIATLNTRVAQRSIAISFAFHKWLAYRLATWNAPCVVTTADISMPPYHDTLSRVFLNSEWLIFMSRCISRPVFGVCHSLREAERPRTGKTTPTTRSSGSA